jgi:DNA-directed RNA polymerase specialized sigma24 family protein
LEPLGLAVTRREQQPKNVPGEPPRRSVASSALFRREVLSALLSLVPDVRRRVDLGFAADDREDALMEAITRLIEHEWSASEPADPANGDDGVSRLAHVYAARVVRNQLLSQVRRNARWPSLADLERHPGPAVGPGQGLTAEQSAILGNILEGTSEADVRLLLAYFDRPEAFDDEVARQSLREGTARVRVHRALVRLRERAGRPGTVDEPGRE